MTRGTKLETVESLLARTREEGDCLIWQGYLQTSTVPMVAHGGKMTAVRRLLLEFTGKRTPRGGYFSTKCGVLGCVNPDHIQYMNKTKFAMHMTNKLVNNPSVMAVRNAKLSKVRMTLTDEQREEIRHSNESTRTLAEKFGVSATTILKHRKGTMGRTLNRNPWAQLMMGGK